MQYELQEREKNKQQTISFTDKYVRFTAQYEFVVHQNYKGGDKSWA